MTIFSGGADVSPVRQNDAESNLPVYKKKKGQGIYAPLAPK
jgi:hypothetical protein